MGCKWPACAASISCLGVYSESPTVVAAAVAAVVVTVVVVVVVALAAAV